MVCSMSPTTTVQLQLENIFLLEEETFCKKINRPFVTQKNIRENS